MIVRALGASGLPSPTGLAGDLVESMWKAGLFRLRAVLVGTLAFQTYAGFLGVRIPNATIMTGDIDIAQFQSIAAGVEDELAPSMLEALRSVDPSFQPIPHIGDPTATTRFGNSKGFEVEFLTPNQGSDDPAGKPVAMPALGSVSAEPLRFLDFLIRSPVTSVLVHKAGVPVLVPAPERYAIHKLIVASRRRTDDNGRQKSRKDLMQASVLIGALALERRLEDAGAAWVEAFDRGPAWRGALQKSRRQLDDDVTAALARAIDDHCAAAGADPKAYAG